MGRHEPLTSLALGRSPYDGVVEGEGEGDLREPDKQYDETGRIVNPQTRQIIKDVIRAHNEVMLVIGVAEPEHGGSNTTDAEAAREHYEYESNTGKAAIELGRTLTTTGLWGLQGIRQRVLVYTDRADISFLQLLHLERVTHSSIGSYLVGIPSLLALRGLKLLSNSPPFEDKIWYRGAVAYVRFHFQLFIMLQHNKLVPSNRWVPHIKFFLPFSDESPVVPLPPLESIDATTVARWAGTIALNLAPYAAFSVFSLLSQWVYSRVDYHVLKKLPRPYPGPLLGAQASLSSVPSRRQAVIESPTLGAADREIRHVPNLEVDIPTPLALDGQLNGEPPIQVGAIRRQGTFSSRGAEDYATDEDDAEMVNPTLISFDVDTSESAEPPTGVWSAELRPSMNGDARPQLKETPVYVMNPLTVLPARFASEIISSSITNLLLSPLESVVNRVVARAFMSRRGLPLYGIYGINPIQVLSWGSMLSLFQLEMVRFLISSEIWALTTILSQWLHVTEEEWKEIHKEEAQQAINDAS